MKSLGTLLKLAERDLDLLQRALGDQFAKLRRVEERILGHDQTLRAEQQAAMRDYESARAYGGYAVLAMGVRRALEAEKQAIEQEVERLRDLIKTAHVEMRKFERLIELDAAREHAKAEKREAAELDEFATLRRANRP
jgi:flagellar protein FliJ